MYKLVGNIRIKREDIKQSIKRFGMRIFPDDCLLKQNREPLSDIVVEDIMLMIMINLLGLTKIS